MKQAISREQYQRAEKLMATNTGNYVFNSLIKAHWLGQTERFWYKRELRMASGRGKQFILVDPRQSTSRLAFDHQKLAETLSHGLGKVCDPDKLPFEQFAFKHDEQAIVFHVEKQPWICQLDDYTCAPLATEDAKTAESHQSVRKDELPSPDGRWAAFLTEYNLYVRSLETGEIVQLTYDGQAYYDYATQPESRTTAVTERLHGIKHPPTALWSPDSKKLITYRLDQRFVRDLHLVQSVPSGEDVRPVLHSYRYPFPGDEHIAQMELLCIDIEKGTIVPLDAQPQPVPFLFTLLREGIRLAGWSSDSEKAYYVRLSRDCKTAEFVITDPQTGSHHTLLKEHSDTFLNIDIGHLSEVADHSVLYEPNIRLIGDGRSFIWQSERDGWAHLYLYDARSGELRHRLTQGPWAVRNIEAIDEERGWLYFTAGGREEGRDPYYLHLYRVRLDGSDLTLLTPEDAMHMVTFSPGLEYFVDVFSRVDLPPVSILRAADGRLIRELEKADIGLLMAQGYQMPQRITVKAHDGMPDLYGVLVRPADFDPARKYPVIDYFYGGVQRINTPKFFCAEAYAGILDLLGDAQPFAQLGFATVILDGMGTPFRSKAFHDVSYGNLQGAAGLIDHVAGIKQLAEHYPFLDLDRVGIWGASGGGYGSVRAMLTYPDVYKVAVAGCGNHDQRLYVHAWGERYHGAYDAELYREQDNATLAHNLRGHLLLAHGDLDDNVHPAHTLRLVDALIKANKDFDLLIMPNKDHRFYTDRYFIRRKWDYFVTYLLGAEPPKGYIIREEDSQ